MKRIATATLVFCLLSGTSAVAQHDNRGQSNSRQPHSGQPHSGQPNVVPLHVQQHTTTQGPTVQPNVGQPHVQQHTTPQGPMVRPNVGQPNVTQSFHPRFGAPGYHPGGQQPQYSPRYFPPTFNMGVRYHWRERSWQGPPGWAYRPWRFGQFLPFAWLGASWWINDYWYYDLPVPPYGYEWIRNGPDALLVQIRTGRIVEVVPGIFY